MDHTIDRSPEFCALSVNGNKRCTELAMLSLAEASARIASGSVTSTQLTAATLQRIAAYDQQLNAYITVCGEDAMARARELDIEQQAGQLRGPLHGIPI